MNRSFAALLAALFGATALSANPLDFEQVAPQRLRTQETPAATPRALTQASDADSTTRVVDSLRAVVLLDAPGALDPRGPRVDPGIHAPAGGTLADARLHKAIEPYLGKPATFGDLHAIAAEIVRAYRRADRPIVDVRIPEQDVTGGAVQFIATEAVLGKVSTEGERWFPSSRLAAGVRAQPGEPISGSGLLDDMGWLNRNPFRRSEIVFRKGDQPGTTDLIVRTSDRLPFRPYFGYDDDGTDPTDYHRLKAGFNWGNAFGLDQVISYQFLSAPDPDKFHAHSAIWSIPLPWRNLVELYGSYATSNPDTVDTDLEADSLQLGTRYVVPLPGREGFRHDLTGGFEFKQSNNDLLFGGDSVFASDTEILQFRASYMARIADRGGVTSAQIGGVWSPGDLTNSNSDEAFEQERAGAEAQYLYGFARAERTQRLPFGASLGVTLTGQYADANLLASEQFSLGGAYSLRGFDQSVANGDRGWSAVVDLYSPPVSPLRWFGRRTGTPDELRLVAFYGAGGIGIAEPLPGEPEDYSLQSAGVGVRYDIGTRVSIRFDYGWQIERVPELDPNSSRAHISVLVSY